MSFGHKSKITFIRKAKSRDEILEEEQDLQDSRGAPPANFVSFLTPEAFGWMNKRRPNAKSSAAKEHIPPSKALMLKQIFRGLDFDGSGEISLDELKEAISYVAGNHLEGEKPIFDDVEKITKFFEAMDTDGSGAVDFNEFLVAMTSQGKDSASTDMNRMQHAFKDFAKKHRRQKLIDRLEDKTLDDLDRLEVLTSVGNPTHSFTHSFIHSFAHILTHLLRKQGNCFHFNTLSPRRQTSIALMSK